MRRFLFSTWIRSLTVHAWRTVIFLVGMAIVLLGIVLLPLPGPGSVVVALGLAILSVEFVWARHGLAKLKAAARQLQARVLRAPVPQPTPATKTSLSRQTRSVRIRRPTPR